MAKYQESAPIILAELEKGATQKEAAEKAGINIDTFYEWMKSKTEFSDAVRRAKENARLNAVASVEHSLLELAQGFEYEEVRTEYESKHNPDSGQYEPVIKKQVRTKKCIPANTEAIKFFLTNKAPAEWKNRNEHEIANADALKGLRIDIGGIPDGEHIVGYNTYTNSQGPDNYGKSLGEFLKKRGYFGPVLIGIRDKRHHLQ